MQKRICVIIAVVVLLLVIWYVPKEHSVVLVIPAGSQGELVYAQEELLTLKKQIVVQSIDLSDDATLILENGDLRETVTKLPYAESLIVSVNRGKWYTVGVSMPNPTQEDIRVCIHFENVKARSKEVS